MSEGDTQARIAQPTSFMPTWFLALATVPILLGLLYFCRDFLIPIALALLLFILVTAFIRRLQSIEILGWAPPRWVSSLIGIGMFFLAIIFLAAVISDQIAAMTDAGPRYTARFESLLADVTEVIGDQRVAALRSAVAGIDLGAWVSTVVDTVSGLLGVVSLVLLYLGFMLAERGAFSEKLPRLCASRVEAARLTATLRSISESVQQYMWINTVTSALSGLLAYIVLKLVGVDFAAFLALFVFLVNFIPNIGSVLGVILPTLVAILQFDGLMPAVIVAVVYGGGDAIIGNVVQPAMQGKSLNLSTIMVMIALTFWGAMWGGVGAFMAVPLTMVTMIVCAEIPALLSVAILLSSDGVLPGTNAAHATDTSG
ncbi:AI-2E family transporter [Phaeobacter marinintestinus]|uniref:AI-2E family transporter n=1 Tax=Falsiphaeobacter marinintestinus TaxID=1492905 RepID=UPI0011B57531|nr:AI-2E family transporter [Phaeobacter marinintestinus]